MNANDAIYAVEAFESVQERHAEVLKDGIRKIAGEAGASPDFAGMAEEREEAMTHLRAVMDEVLQKAVVSDLENIAPLVARMEGLLQKEDELKFLALKARQELKKRLSHMQSGKKALGGYQKTMKRY